MSKQFWDRSGESEWLCLQSAYIAQQLSIDLDVSMWNVASQLSKKKPKMFEKVKKAETNTFVYAYLLMIHSRFSFITHVYSVTCYTVYKNLQLFK